MIFAVFNSGALFFSLLMTLSLAEVRFPEHILSPVSRTVLPASVYQNPANVTDAAALTGNHTGTAVLTGLSHVTYDFGINIGGILSLTASANPSGDHSTPAVWASFSESSLWINHLACDATADSGFDAPLYFPLIADGNSHTYTASPEHDRGAFRYLTLMTNFSSSSQAQIKITSLTVNFTASPLAPNDSPAAAYTGYFHSSSTLLNRIWYAGAYTQQLCIIPPSTGDAVPLHGIIQPGDNVTLPNANPWYNNYTIASGPAVLVDGAKRDRLVWPGDLAHALPATMYSVNDDGVAARVAMESIWALQGADGMLPWAGKPINKLGSASATYHLHGLLAVAAYHDFTGDDKWVRDRWNQILKAVGWATGRIDESGMMDIGDATADWLRGGTTGHAITANALLYHTLHKGADMADRVMVDNGIATSWRSKAETLKTAVNQLLWDNGAGMYRDNERSTIHPQDGNSFAAMMNLTTNSSQLEQISSSLRKRWTKYGAPAPEVASTPQTISPFATGFELAAHFATGTDAGVEAGFELMKQQWGYMLDGPGMTNSTFIEGYAADGSLVYAPYPNRARISHAHGWSAGPVWILSGHVAGMKVWSGGRRWEIRPQLGDLESVEAGMKAEMGELEMKIVMGVGENGARTLEEFELTAPKETVGEVILPTGTEGSLSREAGGDKVPLVNGKASGLSGGKWIFQAKMKISLENNQQALG